jgi:hypothetical protein
MTDATNQPTTEEWVVFRKQSVFGYTLTFECGRVLSETEKQMKVDNRYYSTIRKTEMVARGLTEVAASRAVKRAKECYNRYNQACSGAKATLEKAMQQLEADIKMADWSDHPRNNEGQ